MGSGVGGGTGAPCSRQLRALGTPNQKEQKQPHGNLLPERKTNQRGPLPPTHPPNQKHVTKGGERGEARREWEREREGETRLARQVRPGSPSLPTRPGVLHTSLLREAKGERRERERARLPAWARTRKEGQGETERGPGRQREKPREREILPELREELPRESGEWSDPAGPARGRGHGPDHVGAGGEGGSHQYGIGRTKCELGSALVQLVYLSAPLLL